MQSPGSGARRAKQQVQDGAEAVFVQQAAGPLGLLLGLLLWLLSKELKGQAILAKCKNL